MTDISQFLSNNSVFGAVAAVFGGILVRLIDKTLRAKTDYFAEASKIREEMRMNLDTYQKRIDELQKESDEWRTKYWGEFEAHATTKAEYVTLEEKCNRLSSEPHVIPEDDPSDGLK